MEQTKGEREKDEKDFIQYPYCYSQTAIKTKFFVLRDVPDDPAICVLPLNNYYRQVLYANKIEEVLLNLGVKVVKHQQSSKEIIKTQGLELEEDDKVGASVTQKIMAKISKKGSAKDSTIEKYIDYGEINADYIIRSDYSSDRIKILKKDTFEILASFIVESTGVTKGERVYKFKKIIHDSLEALGIEVRDLPPPPQNKTNPPKSSTDEQMFL